MVSYLSAQGYIVVAAKELASRVHELERTLLASTTAEEQIES
jgi:hypothetical protein